MSDNTIMQMVDLIISVDKERTGKENVYELAELQGRKDTVLELLKKVAEL